MTIKMIRPFDPRWVGEYEGEASRLRMALAPQPFIIDHIGSTAIDNLVAKPVIDILIQITGVQVIDDRMTRLEDLGYDARGEYGVAGRRYFNKSVSGGIITGFHVHAFEKGHYQAKRHIAFRDCMRLRPDLARAYANLKRSIADDCGRLPSDYLCRKASFVDLIADVAVMHPDPAAKLIMPYNHPNAGKDDLEIAYHDGWLQALRNEALLLGNNRLSARQS